MTAAWKEEPLGVICQLINRGISPKYVDEGGIAVLNQRCIRDHAIDMSLGRRHDATVRRVPADRLLRAGDVLVNSTGTGTLGRVAQLREATSEPTTVDTHVTIVRAADGLFFPTFFGYALIAIENRLQLGGEGTSGQTELPRSKLANNYRIRFPVDLREQRRIVAILDEVFEGIATAKAHAEKNLQNARELFDSRLIELFDKLGHECARKTLREISIYFGRGKSKHRPRNDPKLYGGPYPFIQTGDVRAADHLITEYTQTYSEVGLAQSKLWPKGTLCITIAANIAETAVLGFDACFPDSVIGVVVDQSQASSKYLEYMLRTVRSALKAKGKGSAQDNINLGTFENERFPVPDLPTQKQVVGLLDDLSLQVQRLEELCESRLAALDELKQSLLHRAFTDQLTSAKQMPVTLPAPDRTATPEFAANVISIAYARHERQQRERTFGRVKQQKLLHLVETLGGIDLGRLPMKDAAGPNDFQHMLKAEAWAKEQSLFELIERDGGYEFRKLKNFDTHLAIASRALGRHADTIKRITDLLIPMDSREAEVFATVHAAWNNLVMDGAEVTDDSIVLEARDRWHPAKLSIPENEFRRAIAIIRAKGLVPNGSGKYVGGQQSLPLPT